MRRINLPEKQTVNFDDLPEIQKAMALAVPFENLDIVNGLLRPVCRENLEEKILLRRRGGLCYELNPMMYYFLKDCGFDVRLVSGTVLQLTGEWTSENGHVTTVLTHNDLPYIIDVGFGSFLPMAPVPFGGEVVKSSAGEYRVLEQTTEMGTHVLQMRNTSALLNEAPLPDWIISYAFRLPEIDEARLNQTQAMTAESETSPFNKGPIIVKRTHTGHIALTPDTFTKFINGKRTKEPVVAAEYEQMLKSNFDLESR